MLSILKEQDPSYATIGCGFLSVIKKWVWILHMKWFESLTNWIQTYNRYVIFKQTYFYVVYCDYEKLSAKCSCFREDLRSNNNYGWKVCSSLWSRKKNSRRSGNMCHLDSRNFEYRNQ